MSAAIYPDTNVLFPISVCDLLLRLAEIRMHEVVWTDYLLQELETRLVREERCSPESASNICRGIRETFPEGRVLPEAYEHLVDDMPGNDPDDRRHSAAALIRSAVLLTEDRKGGFPVQQLAARGVLVRRPDDYLAELFQDFPDDIEVVLREQAAAKKRPPMSLDDVLNALERAGLKQFVEGVRAHLQGAC